MNNNLKLKLIELMKECMDYLESVTYKKVSYKSDGTVVTEADKYLSKFISVELLNLLPDIPVISEEETLYKKILIKNSFWLIDPIDGTASYAKDGKGYTVNIALIEKGFPVFGIVGSPPYNTIWYGQGDKAFIIKSGEHINLNVSPASEEIRIVLSNNPDRDTVSFLKIIDKKKIKKYSSSVKFCKIAEGEADFYPRMQSINKWDIAAGDAILRAAGGIVLDKNGKIFNYNKGGFKTGSFFAVSSMELWKKIINYNNLK